MRGCAFILAVAAGCAAGGAARGEQGEHYRYSCSFSYDRPIRQEVAWRAACAAMAWEGIDVDAMRVTVGPRKDGGTRVLVLVNCHFPEDAGPKEGWDEQVMTRFPPRFAQAVEILEAGKPLPPEPPPLPSGG